MKYFAIIVCCLLTKVALAQDVQATVVVNGSAIRNVDQKIFEGLDEKLTSFINLRRWTEDDYATAEKLELNINLTFTDKEKQDDTYRAKLTVQASRPVYGTDYKTSILNYIDKDVVIKYTQFMNIEFNDNKVVGNDLYASNLPAIVAFYIYYALGLDYDSFSLKGGTPHFNKALNIVNNAPELDGWRREGSKNRFWLIDNINNSRFDAFRTNFYEYHRNGLDQLTTDKTAGYGVIRDQIKLLFQLNKDMPNSAVLFMYFFAKNKEYQNILTETKKEDRTELVQMMSTMDVTNAQKYNDLLKLP
jgi:hypothetical protein